jgi:predicted metalloprotease
MHIKTTLAALAFALATTASSTPQVAAQSYTATTTTDLATVAPYQHLSDTSNAGMDSILFIYLRPNLDRYWGQTLGNMYTAPGWSWINRSGGTATACGNITLENAAKQAAFYCPRDKVLYFNADFLQYQERLFGFPGIATVIAHEYGHHIQNLEGWASVMTTQQEELQADRDAGAYLRWAGWTYTTNNGGIASWYTLSDVQGVAWAAGDYLYSDPDHHGTPSERSEAVTRGWNNGPGLSSAAI